MDEIDSDLVGRAIAGKFQIHACVGIGSSASVYRAEQTTLGRTVAIKVLNPELARDEKLVRRFHDEALAASRLNHPNTVAVIDYGQTEDGLLYLVMEYVGGKTLTELIQASFPMPAAKIVDLTAQILAGLEEAHHAGVVHADLKSDNIIVRQRRGGWDQVKVVDFGISRIIGAPQKKDEKTICGTPEYMAPEIIGGAEPSFASDLYAVGTILYELLTGHTPFVGGSSLEVLRRQLSNEPVAPSQRRSDLDIPPALENATMRALAKHPGDRFATAHELRVVLERALGRAASEPGIGDETLCQACGVVSPMSFKFCPECGSPRKPATVTVEVSTPDEVAKRHRTSQPNRATARTDYAPAILEDVSELLPLPLVGRDRALDRLEAFVSGEGETSFLQLVGANGSGRSRLLAEVYGRVADSHSAVTIYHACADPTGLASPLYPVRAVVASILSLPPVCPYDALSGALEALGLGRRDLPGVAELFGHAGELWQLEPAVRRRELLASTIRVLRAAAHDGPAVLVFDGVDAFDHPSQELLRRLADQADEHDLRVVVSNGPEFAARWPESVARIDLPALDLDAIEEINAHLVDAGRPGIDPASLLERSGGVPGHVHHLVRYILEGGGLERAPHTIADLIAARIALLPRTSLVVLQTAAVFGTEVDRDLLRHMLANRPENGLETGFDDAVSILSARGLLSEIGVSLVSFPHELVREVVYADTPADVRRTLHAAAATELARTTSDSALLGHHHDLAGHTAEAADLLMRAGDEAVHQLDDLGACGLYQRALRAARTLMLADEGGEGTDSRSRFVTLSVKLADALRVGGEVGLARGLVEEARGHCDGSPALEAQLLRASAHLALTAGDTARGIAIARRAIGQTIPTGRRELLTELYLDLSSMYLRDGESDAALTELEEGLDMLTLGDGERSESGPEQLWRLLLRLAQIHGSAGRTTRAVHFAEHALRHAHRTGSRLGSARVQSMLATLCEKSGDHESAQRHREAAVDEMRRLGDRRGTAELLLSGLNPTRGLMRISPASLREARELAEEVGWTEGADKAGGVRD